MVDRINGNATAKVGIWMLDGNPTDKYEILRQLIQRWQVDNAYQWIVGICGIINQIFNGSMACMVLLMALAEYHRDTGLTHGWFHPSKCWWWWMGL